MARATTSRGASSARSSWAGTKGVVLVAALPEEVQNYTTYVAALTTRARVPDAGRDFIRYLSSASARQVFLATGAW